MIWWEESAKIDVICKIRCVVLVVRIRIAGEKSVLPKEFGREETYFV